MFRHLLVPLDGSRLAESALPVAASLAQRLGASVTLLHVLEPDAPPTVHGDRHLRSPAEAEGYLGGSVDWMANRHVPAALAVNREYDDVAATIARVGGSVDADLIVLTSHGRSGLHGLLYGRVAQQVLQRGTIPVLLVQPSERGRDEPFECRRVLVPLDRSETAEYALRPAVAVAAAFAAEVLLMLIVPTVETVSGERSAPARLLPTATAALLDLEASEAMGYLEQVAARVRIDGTVVAATVGRGDPVKELIDAAARREVNLIVMGTHGRSGVSAVWAGSVASRIVGAGVKPVLLIRIPRSIGSRPDTIHLLA